MNYRCKCKQKYKILKENIEEYFLCFRNWENIFKQLKGLRIYNIKLKNNRFFYVEIEIICMKKCTVYKKSNDKW